MTPILATREGLEAFSKRGPGSALFARFMLETGRVEIVDQLGKSETDNGKEI